MRVREFYDAFKGKLISDYYKPNPRTLCAIKYAVSKLEDRSLKILDIGCGIGWSSSVFARKSLSYSVEGVDLSNELITTAKNLFKSQNLNFKSVDIGNWDPGQAKYDAIIMLDVYEHVDIAERKSFHRKVKKCLNGEGVLILSCPSPRHQKWLLEENPDGLQPIDNSISLMDLHILSEEIGGYIEEYKTIAVWHNADYFHVTIRRSSTFVRTKMSPVRPFESRSSKLKRIRNAGYFELLNATSSKISSVRSHRMVKYWIFKVLKRWGS